MCVCVCAYEYLFLNNTKRILLVFPLGDKILDECLSGEKDRVYIHQSKNTKMTHETIIKKIL